MIYKDIYDTMKKRTEGSPEAVFFASTSLDVREQCVRAKKWIACWLIGNTATAKLYKHKYPTLYKAAKNKDYEPILQDIEKRVTMTIGGTECNDFFVFWTIFQGLVYQSSAYCELIGSTIKPNTRKIVGAAKKFEHVDDIVTVVLHNDKERETINNICIGMSNHLVDIKRGVLMKNDESDIKRQKQPDGKVIARINKGKATKFSTKLTVTSQEITNCLNDQQ